jgi:DNA adenine methylase
VAKDPEGVSEVVNDTDGQLTNFWLCLACPYTFPLLCRQLQNIPFAEGVWKLAQERLAKGCDDPSKLCGGCAAAFFVCCRLSLAGRMNAFAPLSKTRTRRGMNEQASALIRATDGLPEVHQRLRRVVILNRDALEVIRQQDGPQTLFYLDPPYLHATRAAPDVFAHEMDGAAHRQLLETVTDHSLAGKVLLSGYDNALYRQYLGGWNRHDFAISNHAAGGKAKRRMKESVWCNF